MSFAGPKYVQLDPLRFPLARGKIQSQIFRWLSRTKEIMFNFLSNIWYKNLTLNFCSRTGALSHELCVLFVGLHIFLLVKVFFFLAVFSPRRSTTSFVVFCYTLILWQSSSSIIFTQEQKRKRNTIARINSINMDIKTYTRFEEILYERV